MEAARPADASSVITVAASNSPEELCRELALSETPEMLVVQI
jgi:hypothetical protein